MPVHKLVADPWSDGNDAPTEAAPTTTNMTVAAPANAVLAPAAAKAAAAIPAPAQVPVADLSSSSAAATPEIGASATLPPPLSAATADDEFTIETSAAVRTFLKFDHMNLRDDLLRGVYSKGFENPSPIQQKAIVPIVEGRDVVVQAQSGTGKTGTFAIAALQKVDTDLRGTQILILSPTRDLALQSEKVTRELAVHIPAITVHACVGGTDVRVDSQALHARPHVVVGTPGRIFDMMDRGN